MRSVTKCENIKDVRAQSQFVTTFQGNESTESADALVVIVGDLCTLIECIIYHNWLHAAAHIHANNNGSNQYNQAAALCTQAEQ